MTVHSIAINRLRYYISPSGYKLNHSNFHPLEIVSRYRDTQVWVKITHTVFV